MVSLLLRVSILSCWLVAGGAAAQQSADRGAAGSSASKDASALQGSRPPTVSVKEGVERLVKQVKVRPPAIAMAAHVSGTVVVGAEIDATGKVTQVLVLSGPEMLRTAALEAVRQYSYRPFVIDGTPAAVRTAVQVQFNPGAVSSS